MHAGKRSTWDSGAWRPDARVSLGSAAVAVMLVTAGFTALFSAASFKLMQPAPAVREELVLAEPVPDLPPPRARPRLARPRLPLALPELPRMPPPAALAPLPGPDSFSVQDFLDERARSNAAALKDQVTGKDLQRNLGKQTEKPAISDNQSYRTIDGQRVERGGGGCAESQTQQGSSSPTNHSRWGDPSLVPGARRMRARRWVRHCRTGPASTLSRHPRPESVQGEAAAAGGVRSSGWASVLNTTESKSSVEAGAKIR